MYSLTPGLKSYVVVRETAPTPLSGPRTQLDVRYSMTGSGIVRRSGGVVLKRALRNDQVESSRDGADAGLRLLCERLVQLAIGSDLLLELACEFVHLRGQALLGVLAHQRRALFGGC